MPIASAILHSLWPQREHDIIRTEDVSFCGCARKLCHLTDFVFVLLFSRKTSFSACDARYIAYTETWPVGLFIRNSNSFSVICIVAAFDFCTHRLDQSFSESYEYVATVSIIIDIAFVWCFERFMRVQDGAGLTLTTRPKLFKFDRFIFNFYSWLNVLALIVATFSIISWLSQAFQWTNVVTQNNGHGTLPIFDFVYFDRHGSQRVSK